MIDKKKHNIYIPKAGETLLVGVVGLSEYQIFHQGERVKNVKAMVVGGVNDGEEQVESEKEQDRESKG